MTSPHLDAAVPALISALGERLASDIEGFIDLFTDDATIDVPFDGDGTAAPITGRPAIQQMADSLRGILRFESMTMLHVHPTTAEGVVVCEYESVLHRSDLGGSFRRRYVAVITLEGGRISNLREYGGPLRPV